MISALAGIAAGAIHVLAGPDHLAAVAPLASGGRGRAWTLGLRWGLGHAGGVALAGLAAILLRGFLPLERLSSASERLVGVVLIGIGVMGLHRAMGLGARGADTESAASASASGGPHLHARGRTAFGVGVIHGVAGTSHLAGVLPALALPRAVDGVAYLGGFGVGTIAAMVLFAAVTGSIARGFGNRGAGFYLGWLRGCCAVAIVTGGIWLAR